MHTVFRLQVIASNFNTECRRKSKTEKIYTLKVKKFTAFEKKVEVGRRKSSKLSYYFILF